MPRIRRPRATTAACALGLLAAACGRPEAGPPTRSGTTTATTVATGAATRPPTTPRSPSPGSVDLLAGHYQPLWPFADQAQANAWQLAYRSGGHQPWHLDARQTALSFARGYLGFRHIDRVVGQSVRGAHARVKVGFTRQDGRRPTTASVIHLVRYGRGVDAPWEVVGTDDITLSLTTPGYGSRVRSPMRVGGLITGVDESIRVQVRQPWSAAVLGERCCVPAGGVDRPWSATVSFRAVPGQALTVVASTGGHVTEVERFAVTGVRLDR